ncbi:hypothetical protein [Kitasatospora phosalacinea]|uniref:Uncharacterized protein n=1 Tax=Kitasatospora phosalacinea TaxID=2065 RepID=A0ABW6GH72_9ACTN
MVQCRPAYFVAEDTGRRAEPGDGLRELGESGAGGEESGDRTG